MSSDVFHSSMAGASRPRTASDFVSTSLRRSILTGELEGGTRLSLTDLASIFDVSTTPIREALRELSFEGLVRLDSYRGGVVTAVTRDEAEEIVAIRQVLEPLAIAEAMQAMTEEILGDAADILTEMSASDDWDTWVHGNRAFHRKFYEAASSKRLVSLIEGLQDTTVVFVSSTLRRSPILKEDASAEHGLMLQAARDRDVATFTDLTLRHLTIPVRN